MLNFVKDYISKYAQKRADFMNIYEITDLWIHENSDKHWVVSGKAYYPMMAAACGFISIGMAMIFSTPIESSSQVLTKDQGVGLLIALFFTACLPAMFWYHHFLKAKLEIIRDAKNRLSMDPELHEEYLACVERAGALAEANSRAAAAAQEARNAMLQGQAIKAQIRAADAQTEAARKEEASRLSLGERNALASSIRHNTAMAEIARRNGRRAGEYEGKAAADAAKLAGGRR